MEVCAWMNATPPCPRNSDGNEEFCPIVMIEEPIDCTVAVIRDDRSLTRSAISVPLEELFRRIETCCPATKSAGPVNEDEKEEVPT